ncbi:DUF1707 domain-containing protein [Amycolatopsis sp. NBC_01488]|uniref:DUF1707 SHOCT-like domain-containing protein n=1 Tax=Amycolatopsis sp. NBC_01488 TaxID=2903563 RepID=UPI002E2BADC8|nr:DUF1707 domain-containing protein [Amycolatopsis sp. NBC_01488]
MTEATEQALPQPGVRCSDAEREQTRARLHTAAAEGRLSMDEIEERMTRVYALKFRHDLDALTADLPAPESSPATARGWRPILEAIGRQLAAEIRTLLARGGAAGSRQRRLVIALVLLVFVAAMTVAAFHGFDGEGAEHHGFGRD